MIVDQLFNFIQSNLNFFLRHIQMWAETKRLVATGQNDKMIFVQHFAHPVAVCSVRQIKSTHQASSSRIGNNVRIFFCQLLKSVQQITTDGFCVLTKIFFFNHFQNQFKPHHINEVSSESGINSGAFTEYIIRDLVKLLFVGKDSAHLSFLSESNDVRLCCKMFKSPHFSCDSDAGLHFVKNQKYFILITKIAQSAEKFIPEMMIAT